MSDVVRSIDFIIDQNGIINKSGSVYEIGSPAVKFHIEQLADGTLRVTASVFDNDGNTIKDTADLRGVFFHIAGIDNNTANDAWVKKLTVTGVGSSAAYINGIALDGDGVDNVPEGSNSDNMNGRPLTPYDVGIGVGTSGIGTDDIKSVTFVLDHATDNLTLEHLAQQGFGARLTSVGAEGGRRSDSLKLWGVAPSAPVSLPPAKVSLSDRVWEDVDGNGIQDAGEAGLGGVTVNLLDVNGANVATRVTDSTGAYNFSDLVAGQYSVAFAAPAGYVLTQRDQGGNDAADSDADPATGRTGVYTLTPGMNENSVDGGFYKPAAIGDLVWEDLNANGLQDAGEAGLSGIAIKLLNAGGSVVATTTTGADGAYSFNKVVPGTYSVEFAAPEGYTFSPNDQGASDALDSDAGSSGRTGVFTVTSGTSNLSLDAGVHKVVSTPPEPANPGPTEPPVVTPDGDYDDLIEAGDGDDIIHGGRGNDEMQGEGGNDTILGGTDDGRLEWNGDTLKKVTIGDNLYGNDGADTYFYEKGDGVDLIWDFRPDEDTIVLGFSSMEIIGATYVRGVTNRIETPSHDKIALILGKGATIHDAIVINDFGGLKDSERKAFVFANGKTMSMKDIIALTESKPVSTELPETWSGVSVSGSRASSRMSNSLDLFGSNDAEALIGRAGNDRLYGNEGFNKLNGNDGFDELYGGNVEDILIGGNGNDLGFGNGGADTIIGGVGSDKLYGAGGADIIYGDTDGVDDGKNISRSGFDFRFNLRLEEKYRALFDPADPVDGTSVSAGPLVITPGKNWWGGFEVTVTVKADASLAGWNLFLNSAYEITSVWGAELSKVQSGSTSALYELKNAPWNGSLAKGQTTTIGLTVRTPFNLVVDDKSLLLKGLKIGPEATLDSEVEGAVGLINTKLSSMKEVTTSESYTLTGDAQKLVAVSGSKAIDLSGNKLGNIIVGNDGSNEIAGRAGKDVLTGNNGKDAFLFDTALSKANLDTITDFSVKDDRFYLDNAIFKKLGSGKPTNPKQLNKNFFSLDKAKDRNDYLIYNKKTGTLSYDADGSGKSQAIEFAKIKAGSSSSSAISTSSDDRQISYLTKETRRAGNARLLPSDGHSQVNCQTAKGRTARVPA
ncbi:carboxypeptidase regulatory-like domain-containing protein [Microvirga sp. BT689]|uniref:SdrD B-like domain-containing protein n=1 Tax=Microvirga arvi TaxID=2778731 RepID=UPI00194ECD3E|nr:SdrD B-like domain-containing protein [Microvirga arvi]MBM6582028.1 carboxypeptidase regulatory-like domain-containing protein [Microvirga arvi]